MHLLWSIEFSKGGFFPFSEKKKGTKLHLSLDKTSQALSGQKTNNEQVILFALPASKHKTNKERNCLSRIHTQPSCTHYWCGMLFLVWNGHFHFLSLCLLILSGRCMFSVPSWFCPHFSQTQTIKELQYFFHTFSKILKQHSCPSGNFVFELKIKYRKVKWQIQQL